jgi:hypothetical protein
MNLWIGSVHIDYANWKEGERLKLGTLRPFDLISSLGKSNEYVGRITMWRFWKRGYHSKEHLRRQVNVLELWHLF